MMGAQIHSHPQPSRSGDCKLNPCFRLKRQISAVRQRRSTSAGPRVCQRSPEVLITSRGAGQGLAVSVGPAIAAAFAPFWGALAAAARLAARRLRVALLALQPLCEPLAYLACFYFIGSSRQVLSSHHIRCRPHACSRLARCYPARGRVIGHSCCILTCKRHRCCRAAAAVALVSAEDCRAAPAASAKCNMHGQSIVCVAWAVRGGPPLPR